MAVQAAAEEEVEQSRVTIIFALLGSLLQLGHFSTHDWQKKIWQNPKVWWQKKRVGFGQDFVRFFCDITNTSARMAQGNCQWNITEVTKIWWFTFSFHRLPLEEVNHYSNGHIIWHFFSIFPVSTPPAVLLAMPRKKKSNAAKHLPPDFHAGYQYPPWVKPMFRYEMDESDSYSSSESSDDEEWLGWSLTSWPASPVTHSRLSVVDVIKANFNKQSKGIWIYLVSGLMARQLAASK